MFHDRASAFDLVRLASAAVVAVAMAHHLTITTIVVVHLVATAHAVTTTVVALHRRATTMAVILAMTAMAHHAAVAPRLMTTMVHHAADAHQLMTILHHHVVEDTSQSRTQTDTAVSHTLGVRAVRRETAAEATAVVAAEVASHMRSGLTGDYYHLHLAYEY